MNRHAILLTIAAALVCGITKAADPLQITNFRQAGPFAVSVPFLLDSTDCAFHKYDPTSLLDSPVALSNLEGAAFTTTPDMSRNALHLIGFSVQNSIYTKADFKVEGLQHSTVFIDGKLAQTGEVRLEPGTHDFAIKYLCLEGDKDDSLKVSLTPTVDGRLSVREDGQRIYDLDINSYGVACAGISLSPSGKYMAVGRRMTDENGKNSATWEILRTSDLKLMCRCDDQVEWMPRSDMFLTTRPTATGEQLLKTDPATGEQTVIVKDMPQGWHQMAPTEDYLIYTRVKEGPKEGEVHQVLNPEDRQPGWRDRYYLEKYDIATGTVQPLTFGWHSTMLEDISADGRKILFAVSDLRLTKRPTTLSSIYEMDLATLQTRCLIEKDGFINGVQYSPDGQSLLVTCTPEALGGVGRNLPEDRIPNGYDIQLMRMDIASGAITPLTKDFAPSVEQAIWSPADGKVYVLAEDKDCVTLFRIDPQTAKWERVTCAEDYVNGLDIARSARMLVYKGQSLENGDRAYLVDTKTGKQKLVRDFSAERLAGTQMGKGGAYEFTSSRGDLINGFYVLPPDFDPAKKYPLLVHYYGGCSPSSRYCIGAYSPQVYAAQGYIFYVINPSGAAGFGQEFASRHVNTAGDGVAEDIIEGTLAFCKDHPYVDSTKIGCFSASYGGFMTQLLLTKTDIYATGISHAGISDHTSYWGEGYWGYSYSEVSMADSYPWTRKDLYVDRSPLYMADRIHTPLLFLHGSADTNVPIGESIQMFTALKLLGQDTAFVVVDGENHGVYDFAKRRQWLRTIFAWFSKYLQDDPTWWNDMYPEKQL